MASSGSFNTSGYNGRYLQFSWSISSQSIANNQTTISWSLTGRGTAPSSYYKAGNFKVVIDGSTVYSTPRDTRINLYNGTVVASGNYTMTHNAQGQRSFSASAQAGIYTYDVNCTGSGSWSLTDIPRQATITSAPNFNDEQNPTINYTNPAGNNVTTLQACISLTGSTSDIAYRDISKTGTSYTFNLTDSERNVLRQATTTSNTRTVYFYIKTIIGGNTFYNNVGKTLTIINNKPTFSVAYLDTKSQTTTITGNNQKIIQNNSTLRINITNATALKYATLSNAKVTINGTATTKNFTSGSLSLTIDIGTINVSSNLSVPVVVTDSRGNTTTHTLNVQVLPWSLPTAIITCQRKSNFYSETDINVNADYSSLNNKNQITIKYQYKKTTDSSYSALQTLQDDVTTTFTIDNLYAWNVKVIITDLLGSTTYNIFVDKGTPLIFFDRKLFSVGVNCLPTNEYSIESSHLSIDDVIYVGSQVLYDSYQMTTATKQAVLGSYNYDLVQGVFNGINIPSAYTRAYRITAQCHTQNNNQASVWLNNIQSSTVNTWSDITMRKIASTRIFKESEIELEQTYNYTSKNGTNLYCQNSGSYQANFWNITVHAYLVKNTTDLTALSTYGTTNTVSQA